MSLYFAGSITSYLQIPSSTQLDFGTGDFTIEWWQYQEYDESAPVAFPRVFSRGKYLVNVVIAVSIEEKNSIRFWEGNTEIINQTITDLDFLNKWVHFAVSRQGPFLQIFMNGVRIAYATDTTDNYGTNDLFIGNEGPPDSNSSFQGYITGFVWTKGISRYNSNFTPPLKLPQITSETVLALSGGEFFVSFGSSDSVTKSSVLVSSFLPDGYNSKSPTSWSPSANVLSPPILTILNNGVLNSPKAMPFKDSTSDGTSSFSSARQWYIRTMFRKPLTEVEQIFKKNYSGAKDAATVIETKKQNQIAIGSLNAKSESMSFKTTNDVNVRNSALRRVRRGGAGVPVKARLRGKDIGSVMNY